MTRLKTFLGAALYACAACAGAQAVLPTVKDSAGQAESGRVPKGGAAPTLDMRIQDAGIALPKGLEEQQSGEAPKADDKPAPAPAPRASEQPAPPSPPR